MCFEWCLLACSSMSLERKPKTEAVMRSIKLKEVQAEVENDRPGVMISLFFKDTTHGQIN